MLWGGGEGPRRPGRLFLLGGDAPEGLDGLRGRGRRGRGVKRDGRGGRRKGCGGGFRVGATLSHGVRSYAMRLSPQTAHTLQTRRHPGKPTLTVTWVASCWDISPENEEDTGGGSGGEPRGGSHLDGAVGGVTGEQGVVGRAGGTGLGRRRWVVQGANTGGGDGTNGSTNIMQQQQQCSNNNNSKHAWGKHFRMS